MNTKNKKKLSVKDASALHHEIPHIYTDREITENLMENIHREQQSMFDAVICSILEQIPFTEWAELIFHAISSALKKHTYEPIEIIAELIELLENSADDIDRAVVLREEEHDRLEALVQELPSKYWQRLSLALGL